ncbi:MAG TPA: hypothetical protein VGD66_01135 [Allosphingosinicella sp.]|jgi:hypothetical protein
MVKKLVRLFLIKNRLEAWAVIYALAVGACSRGNAYVAVYPGIAGKLLYAACTVAVFMAGAKILDATRPPRHREASLLRVLARARAS